MSLQTSQKAELFGRILKIAVLGMFAVFGWAFVLSLSFSPLTDAATSSTINFQARLESSAGNIAPDGTYNVEFKLYNAASSSGSSQGSCTGDSACLWTEDYLVSASNGIHVVNGYLTANLGSITAFPSNMNWNQQLWLTMRIGGTASSPTWDTEMSPRLLLTATPYSFQAGELSATTSGYIGTLSFASTLTGTDSIIIPNTGGTGGTICLESSTACGFLTGSGTGVQLQGSSPGSPQAGNFNVSGTGIAGVLQAGTFDTPISETLNLGSTNASAITIGNSTNNIATTINGTVIIKPTSGHDSATAFQVQNASGTSLLTVDTAGSNITVDNSGATGTIQVGNTTGAVNQIINVGTNNTAGSSSNVTIGSAVDNEVPSVFNETGSTQTYTVPAGVTSLTINVLGASGGLTGYSDYNPGLGGQVQGTLTVTPGEVLTVYVGEQGGNAPTLTGSGGTGGFGYGTGGNGGNGQAGYGGGAGGGSSAIVHSGTVLAEAGGGAGEDGLSVPGGNGGGTSGDAGYGNDIPANGGGGGTPSAVGSGGTGGTNSGLPGSGSNGGSGGAGVSSSWYVGGGGGGGGYYGGGGGSGGGSSTDSDGGGGGGSSYVPAGGTTNDGVQGGNGQVIITPVAGISTTLIQAGATNESLTNSGATIQTSIDSTTAFQIQDAAGATVLSTDTTTNTMNLNGTLNLNQVSSPDSGPTAAVGSSGLLTGTYYYVVTYLTDAGTETNFGPPSNSVSPSSQQVNLTNIPVSPSGYVTSRNIYRGTSMFGPFNLVGTIDDNTTTTFTDNNVFPGYTAPDTNMTAQLQINGSNVLIADAYSGNTALGPNALGLLAIGNGWDDTAIGAAALQNNTGGYWNAAVGAMALYSNTTGAGNNAIGYEALSSNTTGNYNSALGLEALSSNTTGNANSALGLGALMSNTTGDNNNAIGTGALSYNTTGYNNSAVGYAALHNTTTGNDNSALGYYAGYQDSGGNFYTPYSIQNATAIGSFAQVQENNSIVLGSVDTATNVGIGTTIPLNTFSVSPMIYNTGTACSVASSGSSTCSSTSTTYLYGSGTTWTSSMVGDELIFADGQESIISAVTSSTAITLSAAVNEASGSYYRIHVIGLQVTNTGNTYVQNTSTTAFQVQNSTGSALLTGDTTNMRLGVDVTYTAMTSPTISAHSTNSSGGTLIHNTTYYYEITAVDAAGGETTPSAQVSQTTGSSPATNTYTITLTWAPITGAAGYHIYRSTTSGTYTGVGYYSTLGTVSGSNLTFTDTNATLNNTTASPPATTTAYVSSNVSNNNLQLSVGGNGTPTGQLYVSGTVPSGAVGSISTGSVAPESIYVQGSYAYVANYYNTIGIYNVSNQSSPVNVGSISTGSGSTPLYLDVQGRYAYVANYGNNTLGIYDISNPSVNCSSSCAVGSVSTGAASTPQSVYVAGNYAFVANYGINSLGIYNISNPANPVAAGSISTGSSSSPSSVYVSGRYAYVANSGNNTLGIYDISNPSVNCSSSCAVGSVSTGSGSSPTSVYVQGRYAYVADFASNTLAIYDISNPASPVSVGSVSTGASTEPRSVYVQGRYAYVDVPDTQSINVYDVSNPSSPQFVGSMSTGSGNHPEALYVSGRYAYVGTQGSANYFDVFDLGGAYIQQLQTGGLETGTLQTDGDATINGDTAIQGGLTVGYNLEVNGNIGSSGSVLLQNQTNSATAFQVQNAAGNSILGVDTTGNQVVLGTTGSSGTNGQLVFNSATASNYTVTLNVSSSTSASYALTLPTTEASTGQCLQAGTVSGSSVPLIFGSCIDNNTSITEVAEWDNHGTSTDITTLGDSPSYAGDLLVLTVQLPGTGVSVATVSGGGVATGGWSKINANSGNGTVNRVEMWMGKVTTTGPGTITLTYNGTVGATNEITATEFTANGVSINTAWGVDTSGVQLNSSSNTITYPSLTSAGPSELYMGYAQSQNAGTAGSTSGFTYIVTGQNNVLTYTSPTLAGTVYQPASHEATAGQSNTVAALITAFISSTAINNSTSLQQANFNVQAASSGSVAGVLQAASGSSTSDILDLKNGSGTAVATFGSSGNVLLQASTTSTTAFQILQGTAGPAVFTVDTVNNAIVLGNDGTPQAETVRGGIATGTNVAGSNLTFQASDGTGTAGSGSILFQTGAPLTSAVQLDATYTGVSNSSPTTWNHTTGTQSNQLLVVSIACEEGETLNVTYNSVALTHLNGGSSPTNLYASGAHADIWYMVNPPSGTFAVSVTDSGNHGCVGTSATFYNVNQSTPFGTSNVVTGTVYSGTNTITNTVSSNSTNQKVIDVLSSDQINDTYSGGSAQTVYQNTFNADNNGSASYASGAATPITMSWRTSAYEADYVDVGVAINPSSSTPTQSDTLTTSLDITNYGDVGIDNVSPQYALDVVGTGNFSTDVLSPVVDAAPSGTLSIGATNATAVNIGNTISNIATTINGTALIKPTSGNDSTAAFQVQNASGVGVLDVDTTDLRVDIGANGTPIGQFYVSGNVPTAAAGSVSTGTNPYNVYVQGNYAYVANFGSNTLTIYDVSIPTSPTSEGSATLPGSNPHPYAVYVQGKYAYVIAENTNILYIYDVSNPHAPTLAGSVATGTNPYDVYVSGRYAYVVNEGASTLTIYDVSNPSQPVQVSGGSVATGTNPYSVYVQGKYAYVANEGGNSLSVYDVSNPGSPTSSSSVTIPGSNPHPYAVYVQGLYAYVVAENTSKLYVYYLGNFGSAPVDEGNVATGTNPYSVFVSGRYAYVANKGGNSLGVYDVSTPASPAAVGTAVTTGTAPYSVFVSGRYAYVVNESSSTLQVFDMGGAYVQQLQTGGIETGTLQVDNNANISGDTSIAGGLTVGQSTVISGNLAVTGSTTLNGPVTTNDSALIQDAGAGINALTVDNNLGIPLVTTGSDNLIINGDFEGSTGTTGWSAVGTGASIVQNANTAYVYSGAGSLAITVSTTANAGAEVTSFNNALPAGTYVLSFWAKTATTFATLEASFSATPGTNNCTLNSNSVSTSAFTEYSCTYTASGTTSAISIGSSGTTALTFYVDAVQLVSASNANLLSNPDFATGTTGWSATGTGATIVQNLNKSTVYDGQADLTVTTGTTANSGAQDSTYIAAQPAGGATYTLSFFAEGTTAFTTLQASLGSGTCTLNSNTLSTTGFQEYYCTATTTSSPTIEIGSSGTSAVVFYLDDVQLVISSSLQSYNIGQTQLGGVVTNPIIFQGNSNSTTSFQIQNASGTSLLTADTTNMQIIIGNTTNGVAISSANGITAYGTARHTDKIVLTAEYAGAVLDNGGASSDIGTMTAGYDSTQKENYYQWTTAQSTNQTYDIVIQIPIPSNFGAWASNDPLTVDINTTDTTNGTVAGTLLDTSGTAVTNWNTCSLTPTVTGWITSGAGATHGATCNITTGTWTAGGVATLRLHMQAPPSGTTKVGNIVLTYIATY